MKDIRFLKTLRQSIFLYLLHHKIMHKRSSKHLIDYVT